VKRAITAELAIIIAIFLGETYFLWKVKG